MSILEKMKSLGKINMFRRIHDTVLTLTKLECVIQVYMSNDNQNSCLHVSKTNIEHGYFTEN